MIREKAVPERWAGPHVDQAVRDLLDDHGLVVSYDNVAGSNFSMMEVDTGWSFSTMPSSGTPVRTRPTRPTAALTTPDDRTRSNRWTAQGVRVHRMCPVDIPGQLPHRTLRTARTANGPATHLQLHRFIERNHPMHDFFRSLSFDSVITALVGDDAIAIAKNDDSVLLPLEVAVEVAAETLRLLLDDERLRNHRGQALAGYLGETDDMELGRILSRIGGPDRPTFTSC